MNRTFSDLKSFAKHIAQLTARIEAPFVVAASEASFVLHRHAVRVFGDNHKLAPLAPSTRVEREERGFTPDDPLLRDGSLLRANVERIAQGLTAAIGSSEPVQKFHEFGFFARDGSPVPARPVFATALTESEPEIDELLDLATGAALGFVDAGAVKRKVFE